MPQPANSSAACKGCAIEGSEHPLEHNKVGERHRCWSVVIQAR